MDHSIPYQEALARLADRIKREPPAIDSGDPTPVFSPSNCARILACVFGRPSQEVLGDLNAEVARRPRKR